MERKIPGTSYYDIFPFWFAFYKDEDIQGLVDYRGVNELRYTFSY
jgi:hypothetical protein